MPDRTDEATQVPIQVAASDAQSPFSCTSLIMANSGKWSSVHATLERVCGVRSDSSHAHRGFYSSNFPHMSCIWSQIHMSLPEHIRSSSSGTTGNEHGSPAYYIKYLCRPTYSLPSFLATNHTPAQWPTPPYSAQVCYASFSKLWLILVSAAGAVGGLGAMGLFHAILALVSFGPLGPVAGNTTFTRRT